EHHAAERRQCRSHRLHNKRRDDLREALEVSAIHERCRRRDDRQLQRGQYERKRRSEDSHSPQRSQNQRRHGVPASLLGTSFWTCLCSTCPRRRRIVSSIVNAASCTSATGRCPSRGTISPSGPCTSSTHCVGSRVTSVAPGSIGISPFTGVENSTVRRLGAAARSSLSVRTATSCPPRTSPMR